MTTITETFPHKISRLLEARVVAVANDDRDAMEAVEAELRAIGEEGSKPQTRSEKR